MEQRRLDEFLEQTCKKIYRGGRTKYYHPIDSDDEPRWQPKKSIRQNLMVKGGQVIEIGAFGQPRPQGRPPGSTTKKSSWKLPEDEQTR